MKSTPDLWVAEIGSLPVAFAQVREDAALDQWVVSRLNANAAVVMVASGGCTAAALASMPQVSRLHLVDPNPAQIALARLKLRLAANRDHDRRLALLGHKFMPVAERRAQLEAELSALGLPAGVLGPVDFVATSGPDHAGRYERLFAKLREALSAVRGELDEMLQLRDPAEQSRRAAPETPLGRALDSAFDSVMALPNLVALFGEAATRNRIDPFSAHFARRTRHAFATLPAADNPYLWQMLAGRFPADGVHPWLALCPPKQEPEILWSVAAMSEVLQAAPGAHDLVHLSNTLDWLSPDEAHETLELAWSALRPGGFVFVRQLNSNLDVQAAGGRFEWQREAARSLHGRDRSFFYRGLHLGRKL